MQHHPTLIKCTLSILNDGRTGNDMFPAVRLVGL